MILVSRSERRAITSAASVVFIAIWVSCSNGGGSSPTSPSIDDPSESGGALGLLGLATVDEHIGILEVTVSLQGEEIGHFVSPLARGQDSALIAGTKVGVAPGRYLVEYRFDRLSSSPADVTVEVTGVYTPADGSPRELDLGSYNGRLRQGEALRLQMGL